MCRGKSFGLTLAVSLFHKLCNEEVPEWIQNILHKSAHMNPTWTQDVLLFRTGKNSCPKNQQTNTKPKLWALSQRRNWYQTWFPKCLWHKHLFVSRKNPWFNRNLHKIYWSVLIDTLRIDLCKYNRYRSVLISIFFLKESILFYFISSIKIVAHQKEIILIFFLKQMFSRSFGNSSNWYPSQRSELLHVESLMWQLEETLGCTLWSPDMQTFPLLLMETFRIWR